MSLAGRKKIIIANWKMNPVEPEMAKRLYTSTRQTALGLNRVQVIVAPPSIFLGMLAGNRASKSKKFALAAQDAHAELSGAYTGEVSQAMVKNFGVEYLIIGHSERRKAGEENLLINKKIKSALKLNFKIILCVGEWTRDHNGNYLKMIEEQLLTAFKGVAKLEMKNVLIAYEPVWAIGAQAVENDTPEDFLEQALFIRKILNNIFGKEIAMSAPILYGGSVDASNAEGFLTAGEADGLLVGRVSLVAVEFIKILKIADGAR